MIRPCRWWWWKSAWERLRVAVKWMCFLHRHVMAQRTMLSLYWWSHLMHWLENMDLKGECETPLLSTKTTCLPVIVFLREHDFVFSTESYTWQFCNVKRVFNTDKTQPHYGIMIPSPIHHNQGQCLIRTTPIYSLSCFALIRPHILSDYLKFTWYYL